MLSNLSNTFFPICSFAISLFLTILFFGKKNVINVETKIYSALICVSFVESLSYVSLVFLVDFLYQPSMYLFFSIFNKCLGCIYILWMSLLFWYIINLTKSPEFIDKFKIKKIIPVVNIISFIIVQCLPIELYYDPILHISNSFGTAINFVYGIVALYLILILITIISTKKNDKLRRKILPCYILYFFILISLALRVLDPYFNVTSNILSFILLIMYFTIENPDLKTIRELEIARDLADKANKAKSDFLSSMSHEIRTPLNAIVGFSEDILKYEDKVPEEVVEDSYDIQHASQTLLEIVGNILDINKIESDKMELYETTYRFKEEITNMCRVTSTRIGDKNINFILEFADDIPTELIGDKGKVKEIINNVFSNSIKYTDEGEIYLGIKCVNDLNNNLTNLIITCKDTGKGIKSENINRLFNKFDRLDVELNTTTEGTGLGLAITKALVEMMGGSINVSSQYGVGSIFVIQIPQKIAEIQLPLTNTQALNVKKIQEALEETYKGKKVLVVDDNKLNIKVAKKALSDFEFNIDEAYDGIECLNKVVNGDEYELILMDIMMPNMSGETALSKLKENPNFNIPVIALTADAIAGAKEKYLDEGFVDYIAKPFSRDQIKEKLDIVFKNKD